ncbi:hypothetical protein BMS_1955 [Halobacteriovorax marinus SJ]|uniref:Uncharacterized protein n=1 Tax=Halobacteriovorax marinus (strain ATCC BAA-682 / DSM 15412 / SJ) TaxID=862908 RepID=E1X2K3_HALMS|nr:hypothetical protein [Halobacteriovorax marinus]CBW26770.1 hypothetical protein BMS_1955 [Halobacteriovorax marinus SJ]
MKFIILFLVVQLSFGQEFQVKENAGYNKLERINSIESHIVKVDQNLKSLEKTIKDLKGRDSATKIIKEIQENQKKIQNDLNSLRSEELAQLKRDIEFVDQEKVEKLIDKFVEYQENTNKRIKLLEDSLKEIDGQLKRVDSPVKN